MSNTTTPSGFRISEGPVVRGRAPQSVMPSELSDLPRNYGAPLLFAIPRDPRTIFNYWNVDWSNVFAGGEPVDRQVYLRVKKNDGTDESETVVEPMLGSYYAEVMKPGAEYSTELGYYAGGGAWSVVATSEPVKMPPAGASAETDVDLATVPFHLSFQRLVDVFRGSKANVVNSVVAQLQESVETGAAGGPLTPAEQAIFSAMNLSLQDVDAAYKAFRRDGDALRKKAEALLGFGATSPAQGFGDESAGESPARGFGLNAPSSRS